MKRQPDSAPVLSKLSLLIAISGLVMVGGNGFAQTTTIQPTIQTRMTYTDNSGASSDGQSSDWVAEISPGISMSRRGGPLNGQLNAQFRSVAYIDDSDRNTSYLALGALGSYEAVTNRLFFDARANISRANRSSLTGRGPNDFIDTNKDNETRQFSFGPRFNFNPFGQARGSVSYLETWFSGGGDIESRNVGNFQAGLNESNAFGPLGWGLTYSNTRTRYDGEELGDQSQWQGRGMLMYDITPRVQVNATAGRESNDFSGTGQESFTTKGVGANWTPTPRTSLSASYEDRIFGTGYDVSFRHRFARSAIDASFNRDIQSSLDSRFGGEEERLYREYYDALGTITDPVAREIEARRLVGEQIGGGGVTATVSNSQFIARTARIGYTLVGVRSTFRVQLQQSDRERLGVAVIDDPLDDLSNYDQVTDRSASMSLTRRLSPLTSGSASLSRSKSEGTGVETAETKRTTFSLGLNTRFGENATGGLVYRYQKADGTGAGADFTENVVSANLGIRF